MASLRRRRAGILYEVLIIGLIISTTPLYDGCSRGPEAPSPAEQPSAAAPPPAAQEPAPSAAPSEPPPPPSAPAAPGAGAPPPGAAEAPPAHAPALATPEQLQQLVSPIALYPDMLIAQILTASTYPTQVTDAEQFIKQNPNLTGEALANQVNPQPWDPSVRSLCQFPSVLGMMSRSISWTTALGNAYYTQPQDVLAAVQVMRKRAMQAGRLESTPQQKVVVERAPGGAAQPQVIVIQPAQPNTVYVPSYNPSTVYGQPVAQPPGYSGTEMLVAGVVSFGAGMLLGSLINHGNNNWGTNWYGGHVVYNRQVYYSNSRYFAARYPGYRPGYPYPGYRPGYPGYPGAYRPGYPGYPGYPGNRPGYPAAYPPHTMPYANRNLAATNPNLKPNYGNRPRKGNESRSDKRRRGNVPEAANLAATKPRGSMSKPGNKHSWKETGHSGSRNFEAANRTSRKTGNAGHKLGASGDSKGRSKTGRGHRSGS